MSIQGWYPLRIGWLDLLAVLETLKSLLQHHNSKASIPWHSTFFMVQLSHLYMTTGKIIVLTIQTFVSKVMSLLFIMLSRIVIAFLPRSKHLLILWLQSPSTVILEPNKIEFIPLLPLPLLFATKWRDLMLYYLPNHTKPSLECVYSLGCVREFNKFICMCKHTHIQYYFSFW